jgi:gliding motility-associated-like protein
MKIHLVMTCWGVMLMGMTSAQLPGALVGSASDNGNGCYNLTSNAVGQAGALWFDEQVDLSLPVTLRAEIYLGSQDATGADGMAFMLQDVGQWPVGDTNEDLGIIEGASFSSIGVEIDTWQNAPFSDLAEDHLSIFRDGINNHNIPFFNLDGPVAALASGANIEDGQHHEFRVEWDPGTQTFEVYFDCALRLSWTGDLVGDIFGGQNLVWWGFTAATGGSSNVHSICVPHLEEEHQICSNQSALLELEGVTATTVSWTPTAGLTDATSPITDAQPSITTNYVVEWVNGCGFTLTEETTVEVGQTPDPMLPPVTEFCAGDAVSLSVVVPAGGSAVWSDGTLGGDWMGTATGIQSVDVTSAEGCLGSASTDLVELVPTPVVLPVVGPLCYGESDDIPWPTGTLDWLVDGQLTPSPWTVSPGMYNLDYTDGGTGCPLSLQYQVVEDVPPTPVLPANYALCEGEDVALALDAGAGAIWTWSPTIGLDDPLLEVPTATPTVSTTYNVAVTDACGVVTNLSTAVSLFAVPDPGLPDSVSLCIGDMAVLDITPIGGIPDPVWSDGTTGWTWTGDTPGWMAVTVSPLPDCPGMDSTYLEVESPVAPTFDLGPLCPGDFTFVPWPAGWIDWEVGGTPAPPSGFTVENPGVYFFVAQEQASGCPVAGSIVVPTGALPTLALPDVLELCEEETVTVDVGTPDPVYWNDGTTGPSRIISEPGQYVATHSTDCGSVSDSLLVVEVPCGCDVFSPSAFSPDGDLINDAWRPVFECEPEEYDMRIFDRWGGEVWQSNNPDEYWTGGVREDGRPLDEKLFYVRDGIYAFQVTYRDPTSVVRKIVRKTGYILILR